MPNSVFLFPGSMNFGGNVSASRFLAADGTKALPAFSFINEPSSGWYRNAAGELKLSVLNIDRITTDSQTTAICSPNGGAYFRVLTDIVQVNASTLQIANGGTSRLNFHSSADGILTLTNNADNDFSRFTFGGTSNAYPALKRSSATLIARLADDSANCGFSVADLSCSSLTAASKLLINTAPTISSGFGAAPAASITANNGTAAFLVNVGGGGVATAGVIGMPASSTGWVAVIQNLTAQAANRANQRTVQTASTTASISIQNQLVSTGAAQAWGAQDILLINAFGY